MLHVEGSHRGSGTSFTVFCFAGTGYLTACFALMVGPQGRAVGVEHIPELVSSSIPNIEKSAAGTLLREGSLSVHVGGMSSETLKWKLTQKKTKLTVLLICNENLLSISLCTGNKTPAFFQFVSFQWINCRLRL